MQKNPEIVLPNGTQFVSAGEIPALIAAALHPEPKDEPQMIAGLFKNLRGKRLEEIDVVYDPSITEVDQKELDTIWERLPKLAFPISEAAWLPYEATFRANGNSLQWEPIPQYSSPSGVANIKRRYTQDEHLPLLRTEIKKGELRLLDPVSHVPITLYRDDGIVPVATLTTYAARLSIVVRILAAAPAESKESVSKPASAAQAPVRLPGVTAAVIMEKFHLGPQWKDRLRKAPSGKYKYLQGTWTVKGKRGKGGGETLFSPARVARALVKNKERNRLAVETVINNQFPDYSGEWDEIANREM